MQRTERALRQAIVEQCRWMNASGLNQGTSGNISARHGDVMLITPTGVPYDVLEPEMIAAMPIVEPIVEPTGGPRPRAGEAPAEGQYGSWRGPMRPSSEWRFHLDILRTRPEVGAVVHTHAPHATALAIARRPIPACHYMIAAFGGNDIRCAGYARYGTARLSELVLAALDGRLGCLMANHGMIAIGPGLERAMWLAVELETLARQYLLALAAGGPVLLSQAEIEEAMAGFRSYGQPQSAASPEPVRSRRRGSKTARPGA